ncbi:MAG: hypothetical protein F6K54_32665 [Okeania sp. SIO3B5]|uniref:hypothetical protein n=1 Tax=Okeania sp. SIO3B5 TaxID=2607811 RepID=UPI0013FE8A10|nr:hypothetical protein [Okeania sp. SIO3B5]NEO57415.1 hypothetical protein [Okeania sp. SIO3B5]
MKKPKFKLGDTVVVSRGTIMTAEPGRKYIVAGISLEPTELPSDKSPGVSYFTGTYHYRLMYWDLAEPSNGRTAEWYKAKEKREYQQNIPWTQEIRFNFYNVSEQDLELASEPEVFPSLEVTEFEQNKKG